MVAIPTRIGNFEILRQIGSGGMGSVYLGRDPELDRQVAIKVIREEVHDQEVLDRFFREARAAAALRHPNIITIYASGQQDHQPYMAMEFVDGESLADIIKQRRNVALSDKISYLEQICAGLHFAHHAGIVHRDVKPANVMVDRQGVVRILDFGIARIEGSAMTQDGAMIGSLNYMSPEQMLGRPVDLRSDIFSVGAVAYELLCYQQAFKGGLNDGLLHRLPHEDPPALAALYPGLPPRSNGWSRARWRRRRRGGLRIWRRCAARSSTSRQARSRRKRALFSSRGLAHRRTRRPRPGRRHRQPLPWSYSQRPTSASPAVRRNPPMQPSRRKTLPLRACRDCG